MSQIEKQPTRHPDDTRQAILAAAERRFAEQGFSGTRLEDIGADVGVGRSAVLYHFADKQTLYAAVLEDLFGGALDVLRRALAGAGDLPTRIEGAVRASVAYAVERPAAARIAMREATTNDPTLRAEIQRHAAPFLDLIRVIFEEGERAGVIRSHHPDPLRFVSMISGTTLFYVAALPTLVESLPYVHLSAEAVEALQHDLIEVTRRLLGIRGPRSLPDRKEKA